MPRHSLSRLRKALSDPRISLIIAAYNMARELPRTIRSLSPDMQKEVCCRDYEIIVVDNGSTEPFDESECRRWGADLRFLHFPPSSCSPAAALNAGMAAARGELVGAFIDGARLASPGIVHLAWKASKLVDRAVIATLGFHLGDECQPLSVRRGYDQAAEDKLLQLCGWTEDGYRLFGISVFAVSSKKGWFAPLSESNGLFMRRSMWEELGGFEERFRSAGGGFVNLDLFARAVALPAAQVITLLGEGTFHQVHGGVATNANTRPQPEFRAEYRRIRGAPFETPQYRSIYVGSVPTSALPSVRRSAQMALDETVAGQPTRRRDHHHR